MKPKTIALIILIILALILILQNTQVASFRFFFWPIHMSQIVMTLLTLAIGFIAGYLVAKLMGRERV